jgi:hypothetical protein
MDTNFVAGGPVRLLAVILGIIIGFWFRRAQRNLGLLIAVVALTLTFRCVFESVIAPYYVFPTIAFALVSLSVASWPRSLVAALLAAALTWTSDFDPHVAWVWWVIVAGLAALVAVSWPLASTRGREPRDLVALQPLTQTVTALGEPG